jgi:hypothetical protein
MEILLHHVSFVGLHVAQISRSSVVSPREQQAIMTVDVARAAGAIT